MAIFKQLFTKKKMIVTIGPDTEYKWHKGLCLEAIERSCFIIPGGIFEDGVPVNSVMELSDPNTYIIVEGTGNEEDHPNFNLIVNKIYIIY